MKLTENQVFEKVADQGINCLQKTLQPYKIDFVCISCGYNVIKRKIELTKIHRKQIKFCQ